MKVSKKREKQIVKLNEQLEACTSDIARGVIMRKLKKKIRKHQRETKAVENEKKRMFGVR